MNDVDKIQKDILELAYETFSKKGYDEWFSYPLIPRISEAYLKNRVVVLGQETNTWGDRINNCWQVHELSQVHEWCLDGMCLCNGYDDFIKVEVEGRNYRGKFWDFSRSLYKNALNANICTNGQLSHCWMNLFCVERCKRNEKTKNGKPSQDRALANQVIAIQKDFVYQVMKIIQPRIVLALIGNKNDDIFAKYALGTELDSQKIIRKNLDSVFREEQLAEFEIIDDSNPLHDSLIIRTYHPSYFMGRMKGDKSLYRDLIYGRIKTFLK